MLMIRKGPGGDCKNGSRRSRLAGPRTAAHVPACFVALPDPVRQGSHARFGIEIGPLAFRHSPVPAQCRSISTQRLVNQAKSVVRLMRGCEMKQDVTLGLIFGATSAAQSQIA